MLTFAIQARIFHMYFWNLFLIFIYSFGQYIFSRAQKFKNISLFVETVGLQAHIVALTFPLEEAEERELQTGNST